MSGGEYIQKEMSYTREIEAEINGFRTGNDSEMTRRRSESHLVAE